MNAGSFYPVPALPEQGLQGILFLRYSRRYEAMAAVPFVPARTSMTFFNLDEGRFGKGIINNSKTKIILNLEDDEAMRVQDTLHLSDAEIMEIIHFERGNGLISTNNNNIMVEFKASPLEKRFNYHRPA